MVLSGHLRTKYDELCKTQALNAVSNIGVGNMKKYNQVIFSIGGNQEADVSKNIELQVRVASLFRERDVFPLSISKFYLTPAFPAGIGADFVNCAIRAKTPLSAHQVLQICHQIEAEMGRKRIVRWGERVIDIDLISFNELHKRTICKFTF